MEIIMQVLNNIPINHVSRKLAWNEVLEHIHQGAHKESSKDYDLKINQKHISQF